MAETRERAIKALHRLSEWFFAHGGDSSVDKPIYREDIDAMHEVILASPASDAGEVHRQTPEQVEEDFEKFWRGIVLNEDGSLNVVQIKKELADFHFIIREVPKVYLHITGHRMSKPMYHAEAVIAVADDHLQELIDEAVVEVRSTPSADPDDDGAIRCGCEWASPLNGEVDARWPFELDPFCPVHGEPGGWPKPPADVPVEGGPTSKTEGEDASGLVEVVCGHCEWQGKMLALDLIDHPCPKCGKYGGPAIVRGEGGGDA